MNRKISILITAILLLAFCATQVGAQGTISLQSILERLERVEMYEERIEILERKVAKLLALSDVPPEFSSEGIVEMTEAQYMRWGDEEIRRISLLVPEWKTAFESEDVNKMFAAMAVMLDTAFEFYDLHSRIVTPDPVYELTQSDLTCFMGLLEPFRDLENATVTKTMSFLAIFSEGLESFFSDCDPAAFKELVELLPFE